MTPAMLAKGHRSRRTLGTQLSLVMMGLILLCTASLVVVGAWVGSRVTRGAFESSACTLATTTASGLKDSIAASDDFQHALLGALLDDPAVQGAALFKEDGTVSASQGVAVAFGTIPESVLRDGRCVTRYAGGGLDVAVPIRLAKASASSESMLLPPSPTLTEPPRDIKGAIVLHLSTEQIDQVHRQILLLGVPIALILALVFAALAASVSRSITRPLSDLSQHVAHFPIRMEDLETDEAERPEVASLKAALRKAVKDSESHLRALGDSERRTRAVFEQSPDAMAIVDEQGVIVRQNPGLLTWIGESKERRALHAVFHESDEVTAALARVVVSGAPETLPATLGEVGSELRVGELTLLRLELVGEQLVLASFADRTEKIREEGKRRSLEDQLRHAKKLEALGVMASGIAHDFNNQLNVMLGNLRMALEDLPTEHEVQPLLADVEGAARVCVELTRGLRQYTRREPIKIRPFRIDELLKDTLRLLRHSLPATIRVVLECEPTVKHVLGDAPQIQQVLVNLCLNALDAMPGGGELRLRCENHEIHADTRSPDDAPPGWYARISVTDTGYGMDANTLSKIFDPFFTTKPPGKGTGLGLSMAFGTVRAHGGEIRATSERGMGTCFTIDLPSTDRPIGEIPVVPSEVGRGSETLLLAEDDPRLCNVTQAMLERSGYRVRTAPDGEEALAVLAEHDAQIDLLILDLVMPKLGGEAVLDRLRARGDARPVIIISGYAQDGPDGVRRLHERGATFLQKPYTAADLGQAVREALDGEPPAGPSHRATTDDEPSHS